MTTDEELGLNPFPAATLQQVQDAFVEETRGEGGYLCQNDTELVLDTVKGVQVVVYLDTWTYYGPIWNARLEIPAQDFTAPLLEGPHVDRDQRVEDQIVEVVAWMRKITDSSADRELTAFDPEFDSVFEVKPAGVVVERHDLHAPSVFHDETDDVYIDTPGWEPLTGWTGQHGYRGAVMHASEQFAGPMAAWVRNNPGVYVLTTVEILDEEDAEPAGWAVLRRTS